MEVKMPNRVEMPSGMTFVYRDLTKCIFLVTIDVFLLYFGDKCVA